jgi:hypothetical protein
MRDPIGAYGSRAVAEMPNRILTRTSRPLQTKSMRSSRALRTVTGIGSTGGSGALVWQRSSYEHSWRCTNSRLLWATSGRIANIFRPLPREVRATVRSTKDSPRLDPAPHASSYRTVRAFLSKCLRTWMKEQPATSHDSSNGIRSALTRLSWHPPVAAVGVQRRGKFRGRRQWR